MDTLSSRLTPINDSYPTCELTYVKLLIYSGPTNPNDVTRLLGITPTVIAHKGEEEVNSLGRKRVNKFNCWFLSSEEYVSSKDVRQHLDWILAKLEPVSDQLAELQSYPEVKMSVSCTWWSAFGDGGPTLWPEQMAKMARLNLECGFAIHCPDTD